MVGSVGFHKMELWETPAARSGWRSGFDVGTSFGCGRQEFRPRGWQLRQFPPSLLTLFAEFGGISRRVASASVGVRVHGDN